MFESIETLPSRVVDAWRDKASAPDDAAAALARRFAERFAPFRLLAQAGIPEAVRQHQAAWKARWGNASTKQGLATATG